MAKYAAAIDQGTTSTRFMVFDHSGKIVSVDQKEHEQIFPKPGWVEHDALEIWQRTQEVVRAGLDKVAIGDIAAVGITNQRETTVVWDRGTGKPVYNAIVWQDTRTDKIVDQLSADGGQDRFRAKVGLPLATYFSGPKVKWILDNVDGARAKAERGELAFGNIDAWLIWLLTGGTDGGVHVTDVTNASRTMLMNLETLDWDDEILSTMTIPRSMLPAIRASSETYGEAKGVLAGMKANGTYKGGTVAELWGGQTDQNAFWFKSGNDAVFNPLFKSGPIKKGPQQFVPDWDANNAATIFSQMLVKTSNNIQGVLAANDNIAGAVVADLKAKHLKPLPLSGQDASVQGVQNIISGWQTGTVYKYVPAEANAAAAAAVALIKGQKPKTNTTRKNGAKSEPTLALPVVWITKANYTRLFTDKFLKKTDVCVGTFKQYCK